MIAAFFAHALFAEPGRKGADAAGVPVVIAGGEGADTVAECAAAEPIAAPHPTNAEETAVILYTSGSTGRPRGVLSTQRNVISSIGTWLAIGTALPEYLTRRALKISSPGYFFPSSFTRF